MDNTDRFLQLCLTVLYEVIDIMDQLMSYWYFRLLFVAGLVWLAFDIFEELSNIYYEDREKWHQ